MQKNKIILVLALGMMFTPLFVTKAVETTTSVKTLTPNTANILQAEQNRITMIKAQLAKEADAVKQKIENRKSEIEKTITDIKDVTKKKLDLKTQQSVRTIIEKIYSNLNAQISKINKVDAKISEKINNLEKKGQNTPEIRAQYQIAKTSLQKTEAETVTTIMILIEQTSKETSKEALRVVVKIAEEGIRDTAREYRKILPLLAKAEGDNSIKN